MAISALVKWEVQTGGSDNNGGGFKTGATGVDYSQQTAAQATLSTSSVVNATTTIIDVAVGDHTVSTNDVGNIYQNTGGTSTAGYYEITAVNVGANQWTVDRAIGTAGQTLTGNMGGCLATPGAAAAALTVDGQLIWVKSGTYTLSTATAGKGGPVVMTQHSRMEGYQTTRGDRAARPVLSAGAQNTITLFTISASKEQVVMNMKADGNNQAALTGFVASNNGRNRVVYCEAVNCDQASSKGFNGSGMMLSCYAKDCLIGFSLADQVVSCAANDCPTGFTVTAGGLVVDCVAYGTNATAFDMSNTGSYALRCTAVGSSADGFYCGASVVAITECLATGCAIGYRTTGTRYADVCRCYTYGNTADASGTFLGYAVTVLTADPYVNGGSEDYRPNSTAGGGASLRAASLGIINQTNNVDVGAVQHSDPTANGGGAAVIGSSVIVPVEAL